MITTTCCGRNKRRSGNRSGKRGQFAIEFLTTYGWAILIALIAMGALAYFGVLSPSKYTSKRCSFGAQINCNDFTLLLDGNQPKIRFRLTNNIGSTITFDEISITNDAAVSLSCPMTGMDVNGFPLAVGTMQWADGSTIDIAADCDNAVDAGGFSPGSKNKAKVRIRFHDQQSNNTATGEIYTHQVVGEIYDEVRKP